MKREINTKFYTFSQNNSGGSFVRDDEKGINHYVIIEAQNAEEANNRAEDIGIYFNGCDNDRDGPCCGDRWYSAWSDREGNDQPMIYDKPVEEAESWWDGDAAFVHYYDGTFKKFEL